MIGIPKKCEELTYQRTDNKNLCFINQLKCCFLLDENNSNHGLARDQDVPCPRISKLLLIVSNALVSQQLKYKTYLFNRKINFDLNKNIIHCKFKSSDHRAMLKIQ